MLAKLIKDNDWRQVLVFSKTKHGANKLARFLEEQDITAAPIHGNKSQGARTKALENFKTGKVRVLVATDIAARGIDIPQLPQVVNFDLPHVSEDYVHRIGRTGRAGEVGKAISLVCADEVGELFGIERLIQQVLERRELEGFSPVNKLPESRLDSRQLSLKNRRSLVNILMANVQVRTLADINQQVKTSVMSLVQVLLLSVSQIQLRRRLMAIQPLQRMISQ